MAFNKVHVKNCLNVIFLFHLFISTMVLGETSNVNGQANTSGESGVNSNGIVLSGNSPMVNRRGDTGIRWSESDSDLKDDILQPRRDDYRRGWTANAAGNCSCVDQMAALKADLTSEIEERRALKKALDTYIMELYDLRVRLQDNAKTTASPSLPLKSKAKDNNSVSFSAKLSFNRELKPLETITFDTVLSNSGQGYDKNKGVFTAPLPGVYMFYSTVLSGYNTKVETAIIVSDKEVARMYSGAHDAHGSGSNMAILHLNSNDRVWIRLLYQGGNHIHGYYSTFSGALLDGMER